MSSVMELICCLCNFEAASDDDLTNHIDSVHSDIFRICTDVDLLQSSSSSMGDVDLRATDFKNVLNQESILEVRPCQRFEVSAAATTSTTTSGRLAATACHQSQTRSSRSSRGRANFDHDLRSKTTVKSAPENQNRKRKNTGRFEAPPTASRSPRRLGRPKMARTWSQNEISMSASEKHETDQQRNAKAIDELKEKIAELQQQFDVSRSENLKLKEVLADERLQNSNTKADLHAQITNLDKTISEMKDAEAKAECDNRALSKQVSELRKSESELSQLLKSKNSELCRSRLSVGRLQIEANKLENENRVFKERFDSVIATFKDEIKKLKNEFDVTKQDAERYERIKNVFEKVYQMDEDFCRTSSDSDSFNSLEDDEVPDMIESYLIDSVEVRLNHITQIKAALATLAVCQKANEAKNFLVDRLVKKLKISNETLKSVKFEHKILQQFNKGLEQKILSLVAAIDKTKKDAANSQKIVSDLRMEILELDKLVSDASDENERLKSDKKEAEVSVNALRNELKQREKEFEERVSAMKNELSIKKNEFKKHVCNLKKFMAGKAETLKKAAEMAGEELEKCRRELDEKNKIVEEMKRELSEVSRLAESLKERNDKFLLRELESVSVVAKLRQEIKKRGDEVDELRGQMERLCKNGDLSSQQTFDDMQTEIEELEKALIKSEEERTSMAQRQKELFTKLESQTVAASENEKLLKELRSTHKALIVSYSMLSADFEEAKQLKPDDELEMRYERARVDLKDKEKLIKALQRNNDIIDADLEKLTKEKRFLEVTLNKVEKEAEMKQEKLRADYFDSLRKHSETLKRFQTEVEATMSEKDEEIKELRGERSRLRELEAKIEIAEKEKEARDRELAETQNEMAAKISDAERTISRLRMELKETDREKEKNLMENSDRNSARSETEPSKLNELEQRLNHYEVEMKKLAEEIQNKDDMIDKANKEVLRKSIEINNLESQILEIGEKVKTLEADKQKQQTDLACSQNYFLDQEKLIKELEERLAMCQPVVADHQDSEPAGPSQLLLAADQ